MVVLAGCGAGSEDSHETGTREAAQAETDLHAETQAQVQAESEDHGEAEDHTEAVDHGEAEDHGAAGSHGEGDHGGQAHGAFPRDYAGPVGGQEASALVSTLLWTVDAGTVNGFEGPGDRSFLVVRRTPDIGHYPCTSCHTRPIGSKDAVLAQMHQPRAEHLGAAGVNCNACHDPRNPAGLNLDCTGCHAREGVRELMPSRSAHLTIQLGHPTGRYRNCLTCHAPENPGLLALPDGDRAGMDEAYRLCSGCHFIQARDWAGGAHGKRLSGWAGERVILSCTGCHNPHDPRFPIRRPVTFPKLARREENR
jgi:hypothetical protein